MSVGREDGLEMDCPVISRAVGHGWGDRGRKKAMNSPS